MKKKNKRIGGIPANRIMVPLIVVLAFLHITAIGLILSINTNSTNLSGIMEDSSNYIEEASSLLGGSSLLSETCTNFVLVPVTGNGEVNVGPLKAYANELVITEHRGSTILEDFRHYNVSPETVEDLSVAADSANHMIENQLHALALVTSIYPLPDVPPLNAIPIPELSEEEKTYPEEKRMADARLLVLGPEYGLNKEAVSVNVNACLSDIRAGMEQQSAFIGRRIVLLRIAIWTVTVSIIVILILTFLTIYRQLLAPLKGFVRLISSDSMLDETKGLQEVRRVAIAYNGLMRRRDALDGILRSAASTDTLTNLPNRYGFEQYVLELQEGGRSVGLVLFDVNFLKRINDTLGHAAGDKLLQSSAECISACFGNPEESNCFRFGGDEFAAVVKDATPEQIDNMVQRFREEQEKENISISWGCAYAEDIGETDVKTLMEKADKEMYERKKEMHQDANG